MLRDGRVLQRGALHVHYRPSPKVDGRPQSPCAVPMEPRQLEPALTTCPRPSGRPEPQATSGGSLTRPVYRAQRWLAPVASLIRLRNPYGLRGPESRQDPGISPDGRIAGDPVRKTWARTCLRRRTGLRNNPSVDRDGNLSPLYRACDVAGKLPGMYQDAAQKDGKK